MGDEGGVGGEADLPLALALAGAVGPGVGAHGDSWLPLGLHGVSSSRSSPRLAALTWLLCKYCHHHCYTRPLPGVVVANHRLNFYFFQ